MLTEHELIAAAYQRTERFTADAIEWLAVNLKRFPAFVTFAEDFYRRSDDFDTMVEGFLYMPEDNIPCPNGCGPYPQVSPTPENVEKPDANPKADVHTSGRCRVMGCVCDFASTPENVEEPK